MLVDRMEELRRELNIAAENGCLSGSDILSISQQMDEIILEFIKSQRQGAAEEN